MSLFPFSAYFFFFFAESDQTAERSSQIRHRTNLFAGNGLRNARLEETGEKTQPQYLSLHGPCTIYMISGTLKGRENLSHLAMFSCLI